MKPHPLLSLKVLFIILIAYDQFLAVRSECNICNAGTGTACISQTEFKQCDDNYQQFGNKYSCNGGYYCSILGNCTKVEELSDCKLCGKCDATKTFACTGTKKFALCLGTQQPSEITGQCTNDLTCNINDPRICGNITPTCSYLDDPATTTTAATTTTTSTTTTTPSPAQDPNAFCQYYQKEGRFPVGTNPQTTCKQYVSCVKISTTWYGPVYNCPGQTYFDSSKNGCVTQMPSICAGVVARLAFRNILLE